MKLGHVKAVLFDMHQTITEVNEGFIELSRKVAKEAGIDLYDFPDEAIRAAYDKFDEWFKPFQIEQDVDIHFGNEVEHWTQANRIMFESLGFKDLSDDLLISIEKKWKELLKTWETLRPDARETLFELYNRGYQIGICTRRPDDPTYLLKEWEILDILSTVQWTSVPGYAKPHPYTLVLASDEIGVNPLRCVFVGNSVDADIVAAQRAGMIPVLTSWANPTEVEKAPHGTCIIGEVSELLNFLPGDN